MAIHAAAAPKPAWRARLHLHNPANDRTDLLVLLCAPEVWTRMNHASIQPRFVTVRASILRGIWRHGEWWCFRRTVRASSLKRIIVDRATHESSDLVDDTVISDTKTAATKAEMFHLQNHTSKTT